MRKLVAVLLAALLLSPVLAKAEQKGGIELKSTAEVEVAKKEANGTTVTRRVEADKANVVPGDTVIYTLDYLNHGDTASNVMITNPVPEHMLYLADSAEGAGTRIDFSTDGGKSYAPADRLKVTAADGSQRDAIPADITNIRWTIETLTRGAAGKVSFRAKVK